MNDDYKKPKPKKTRQGSSKNKKWTRVKKKRYRGQGR